VTQVSAGRPCLPPYPNDRRFTELLEQQGVDAERAAHTVRGAARSLCGVACWPRLVLDDLTPTLTLTLTLTLTFTLTLILTLTLSLTLSLTLTFTLTLTLHPTLNPNPHPNPNQARARRRRRR